MNKQKKLFRYFKIYGLRRTLFKSVGRMKHATPLVMFSNKRADIAIVGCGQFAFSTISFFHSNFFLSRIRTCYDLDIDKAAKLAKANKCMFTSDFKDILIDEDVKYVYISSNHASHAEYALDALRHRKVVYVEKPIAVNWEQLTSLAHTMSDSSKASLFSVGYNRPFSDAITTFKCISKSKLNSPISLGCFVSGHIIPLSHWYRHPDEGTRICGNAGHWIDLFVHLLNRRATLPQYLTIHYLPSNTKEPDDNFSLSISTCENDIFNLILTARDEPFEGINETINIQQDNVICKIDDFRNAKYWCGSRLLTKKYRPKDVGHKRAVLQPFKKPERHWKEILYSATLILIITDIVRNGGGIKQVDMKEALSTLDVDLAASYFELKNSLEK